MATIGLRGSLVRPLVTALRRALVESSGFSPLSLFSQGEQGAWYDPSDLSTLFQDSAGTVPVTASGDPAGLMLDKSGNGNHASQSVSARRPIYRTGAGLHWLEFDGVDDFMVSGASLVQPFTRAVGFIATEPGRTILDGDATNSANLAIRPDNLFRAYAGSSGLTAPYTLNTNAVALAVFNGASSRLRINANESLGVVSNVSINGCKIGRLGAIAGGHYLGRYYGHVDVSVDIPSSEQNSLEQYLAQKAGVVL